jgi:hypothetical protein
MKEPFKLDQRIADLDLTLFASIYSQSSDADKQSLLATQHAVRSAFGDYCYLEIGSHLGGSLQPYVVDPRCRRIYSIDKRPEAVPDNRGIAIPYPENSTARCSDNLRPLAPASLDGSSASTPTRSGYRPRASARHLICASSTASTRTRPCGTTFSFACEWRDRMH